jgi:transposase
VVDLAPLLVPGRQAGHPRVFEPRRIADAAFHLWRTGCQWRALPHGYPPWPAVYYHVSRWRRSGTWERVNTELRERHRAGIGRNRQPSAASAYQGLKAWLALTLGWALVLTKHWWTGLRGIWLQASSRPRSRAASMCCRGGGSLKGASHGSAATAAWSGATSA